MSIQNPNSDPYEQGNTTAPGASAAYEPKAYEHVGYDAAGNPPPPPAPGYAPPAGYDPAAPNYIPAPGMPHAPNPMLAALLGFIPGVGAMYNGQFAKGIAHIAIFAVFSSLAKHVNDFFGLFVFGWICYMVFEAYQTAAARRAGLPLPDPFGLNNIGERFGFHGNPDMSHFWAPSQGPTVASETRVDADGRVYRSKTYASGYQSTYHVDPNGSVTSSAGYTAPVGGAVPPPPVPPPPPGYGAGYDPAYGANYGGVNPGAAGYTAPGMPPVPPYPPMPPYGMPPVPPVRQGGLPTGAIWLIGLGAFALLGSLHSFAFLEGEVTGGLFLVGLSVFMFWRRSNATAGMYPQGSPEARWNLIRNSRGASTIFIVGVLTVLQGLHVIAWENSWPFLLIFLGLSMLVQRNAASSIGAVPYPPYPQQPVPPTDQVAEPVVETQHPTSIVPQYTRPSNDLDVHHFDAPHHEDHEEGR